ncbi:hypothetical protein EMIT0357P_60245 [Pseudomonas marginalis]
MVLDAQCLEVGRQHVLGEARLFLVHIDRNDVELDRCDLLQVQQHVEHGVAVFAAGEADHDLVAVLDHVEIGDCLTGQAAQAFLQFVLVDRKSAHGAWIRWRCVTKSRVFYAKKTAKGLTVKDPAAIRPPVYSAICSKGPTVIPVIPSYTAT